MAKRYINAHWEPCVVKRYTAGEEQNNSTGTFTYKGLTLIKNQADTDVSGTSTDAISSTDQFFKDNFSVMLKAEKAYTIFALNTVAENSVVAVRYKDNDDLIISAEYYEMPEVVVITPSTDIYIYAGIRLSAGVQCSGGFLKAEFYRQADWYDTFAYVRENGVWVTEATISGVLPLTAVKTTGDDIFDYKIYGASGGVGNNTINLCDGYFINGGGYWGSSGPSTKRCMAVNLIAVEPLTTYTCSWTNSNLRYAIQQYGSTEKDLSVNPLIADSTWRTGTSYSFTTAQNTHYIWLQFSSVGYVDDVSPDDTKINLVAGSTAPAKHVPYGYEVDMSVSDGATSTTTQIYIGSEPLETGEYINCKNGKIYRMNGGTLTPTDPPVPLPALPTFSNTDTIINYEDIPAPSSAEIKYKRRW